VGEKSYYSPIGVTDNERLISSNELMEVFGKHGFRVKTEVLSGIKLSYVDSKNLGKILKIYNFLDGLLGGTFLGKFIGMWIVGVGKIND